MKTVTYVRYPPRWPANPAGSPLALFDVAQPVDGFPTMKIAQAKIGKSARLLLSTHYFISGTPGYSATSGPSWAV